MRGYTRPGKRRLTTDLQDAYFTFSRGRRAKLAKAAKTNLTKAHEWARGVVVAADLAKALEAVVKAHVGKKKAS
jgi:hypothetical protein